MLLGHSPLYCYLSKWGLSFIVPKRWLPVQHTPGLLIWPKHNAMKRYLGLLYIRHTFSVNEVYLQPLLQYQTALARRDGSPSAWLHVSLRWPQPHKQRVRNLVILFLNEIVHSVATTGWYSPWHFAQQKTNPLALQTIYFWLAREEENWEGCTSTSTLLRLAAVS